MATNLVSSEIVIFAERFAITPEVAHVLPAVFEKVAEVSGQPVRAIIAQATYSNKPLGDYVKAVALQVA